MPKFKLKLDYKTHRLTYIFVIGLMVYSLLMFLLFQAELRGLETHEEEKGQIHSFSEAVWYSIVTLTTVGYGDYYPVTPIGKFLGALLVVGSLGLTGYIIGNVSNSINKYMENKKLGLFGTNFKNHIIIFGYDDFANLVIDQIVNTNHEVAIVTNNKNDIELINDHYGDNDKVFAMFADYTHIESLEKVNIKQAKTIFVNFEDDTETLVYFLNIKAYVPEKDIAVTIYNTSLKGTFINAGVTYIVSKNELSSKLVASFIFEPDVAKLTEDIMSTADDDHQYDMVEIEVKDENPFIGLNCFDLFMKLKIEYDCILLGISKKTSNGKWTLVKNPGKDITVENGDFTIIMANGASKVVLEKFYGVNEGRFTSSNLI